MALGSSEVYLTSPTTGGIGQKQPMPEMIIGAEHTVNTCRETIGKALAAAEVRMNDLQDQLDCARREVGVLASANEALHNAQERTAMAEKERAMPAGRAY